MTDLEILHDTFSIVGTKRLAFPFHPEPGKFILFSDTGGILGEPFKRTLSFASFCKSSRIVVLQEPEKIVGHIKFEAGKEVVFSYSERGELLDLLLDATTTMEKPSRTRVSATSAPSHRPNIWFPAKLPNFEFTESQASNIKEDLLWQSAGVLNGGCFSVQLELEKQRIRLRLFDHVVADLPLSAAALSLSDKTLSCNNRLLIDDQQVDGFTIAFPTSKIATRWLQLIGLSAVVGARQEHANKDVQAPVGLIGQVQVQGILQGASLAKTRCDARIDSNIVRFFKDGDTEYFSVDFDSPQLAIDGTAAEFVVSPEASTAIRVSSESKPFLRAIYGNDAANAAVARSSDIGPFVARDIEGRFVRIETTKDGIAIGYNGGQLSAVSAGIERPVLRITGTQPVLDVADYTIQAELPTLEGICAALTGMSLQPSVSENFENALAQTLGLEGKFLILRVFGKLAAMHMILMNELNIDPHSSCSTVQREEEKQAFLGFMAEVSRDLSLECETVMNYFAGYVTDQDRKFLSAAGLPNSINYSAAENAYQAAVNSTGALLSHFGRIESFTWQFQSSREFAAREEGWAAWAPLGMSIVGTYFNPFLAVSAVQQGVALKRGKDAKLAIGAESIQKLFAPCAREWDFIIRTLLPAISNRFLKQIYPLRLAVTHILRKAYGTADEKTKGVLNQLLAKRIARLTTFLDFPISAELDIKRDVYASFVWETQSNADGMHDRRF